MVAMYVDRKEYRATGTGYAPVGNIEDAQGKKIINLDDSLLEAVKCAALCTTARLVPPQDAGEEWKVIGDPTEGALLTAAAKVGLTADELAKKYPRLRCCPLIPAACECHPFRKSVTAIWPISRRRRPRLSNAAPMFWKTAGKKAWSEQELRSPLSRITPWRAQFTGVGSCQKDVDAGNCPP